MIKGTKRTPIQILLLTFIFKHKMPINEEINRMNSPIGPLNKKTINIMMPNEILSKTG